MDPRLARFVPPMARRLVVKIGSALLVDGDGRLRRDWLAGVCDDVLARRAIGQQVVLVSSGAIALGARMLKLPGGGRASLEDAQAAAATGQIALAHAYADLFGARGLAAAQMLLTLDDLEDRRRYLNAAATLDRLLGLGVVPVLNENDSVATEEIRFGDNDRLAARVAQAASAQAVLLLSDVDGLYTANPAVDPQARLIAEVRDARAAMATADDASGSGMGSGGMRAKIEAAQIAANAGVALAIASGRVDNPLARFFAGGHGTVFHPPAARRARKAWLAGRLTVRGTLHVDAGAAAALVAGKSLLAAGVTAVEGRFDRGDAVAIVIEGRTIARGLIAYDHRDAVRIAGTRNDAQAALLGYAPRNAMIHADQMVLL